MNQTLLSSFGTSTQRVEHALDALREGRGVMVLDDENRENEGDMIFAAENMTVEQMALTIRHGSGIVCLCITEERRQQLDLPMMVENNTSAFGTEREDTTALVCAESAEANGATHANMAPVAITATDVEIIFLTFVISALP